MAEHEFFMQKCLDLAICGIGVVSPNPMVGCVIVVEGRIIGEGYHQNYGGPHAEANAIESVITNYSNADQLLRKATLYVNLEPCAHFGKRPPCSDLIILHKIPKVVVGCSDPFNLVDGKGIEKLKNAGIFVSQNILKDVCIRFNKRFFSYVQKQRPYIILKWAQTADHFFAPVDKTQHWISSKESKMLVHKWRSEEDAVLIGKNTALIDDPQLNVRCWKGRNPIRIIIDRNLQLPKF
ncbi:MAG: bifunctional diaminohydroxyphosphoribosylaminopyrimidine deaminase/5-amino-6-(5-phosphoribosylamino)uracil reductase RibD, partial [Flavobacterium sp.]|nr:bifunctional diaminohydroxyphosphoribosylaminopyrimidine deaminase/5-amino-6-(5-phosphoribosylamino)uracil reductase RibD [Pedobacter sp.]